LVYAENAYSQNPNRIFNRHHLTLKDPVNRCDFCLCSQGISPLDFSGKGIRIDQSYLLIDKMVHNTNTIDNNEGSYEKHLTFQLSGIYSISPRISFMGIVPFSVRSGRDDLNSAVSRTSGIGDVILFARYFPLEVHTMKSTFLLSTQLGLKLPTGKSNEKIGGELIDPHLQIGTGSTDFLFGTNLMYSLNRFNVSSNFIFGLRNRGNTGYQFGNTLNYGLNFGYRVYQSGIGRNIVVLNAGLKGDLHGKDSQDGVIIDDSGGNTTYVSAGVNYFITPRLELEVQFNQPVYYHLYGTQDAETFRFVSGVQFIMF
jgi:hypothetical protein